VEKGNKGILTNLSMNEEKESKLRKMNQKKINENEGKSLNRRSKINYTKIHEKEGKPLMVITQDKTNLILPTKLRKTDQIERRNI
jgi:hypothetical protein